MAHTKMERCSRFGMKEWSEYVEFRLRSGLPVEQGFNLALMEIEIPFKKLGYETFQDFLFNEIPHVENLLLNEDLNRERKVIAIDSIDNLRIGSRVVWFGKDSASFKGTVKWLGSIERILCAGILSDERIGTPFPFEWKGQSLFKTPSGHSLILRVGELILSSDFQRKHSSKLRKMLMRLMRHISFRERPRERRNDQILPIDDTKLQAFDVIYPYAIRPTNINLGDAIRWNYKLFDPKRKLLKNCGTFIGIVKWIGYLNYKSGIVIGVDFHSELLGDNSFGIYEGHKLFNCQKNQGRFLPIKSIERIEKFPKHSKTRRKGSNSSSIESNISSIMSNSKILVNENVELPVESIVSKCISSDRVQNFIGGNRGIHGWNNTSHFVSLLFALFSCSERFDTHFFEAKASKIFTAQVFREFLRNNIVNLLRNEYYVPATFVQILIELINGNHPFYFTEALEKFFKCGDIISDNNNIGQGFISYKNGTCSFVHRILPNTCNLMENVITSKDVIQLDFKLQNLHLKTVPSPGLIIVLPELNEDLAIPKFYIPSLEINLLDLIHTTQRQCVLCGISSDSIVECFECVSISCETASNMLCPPCFDAFHSHPLRKSHTSTKIPSQNMLEKHGTSLFQLQSVICTIQNEKSITFAKIDQSQSNDWILHNSTEESGIPNVHLVTKLEESLKELENDQSNLIEHWDSISNEVKMILSYSRILIYVPKQLQIDKKMDSNHKLNT